MKSSVCVYMNVRGVPTPPDKERLPANKLNVCENGSDGHNISVPAMSTSLRNGKRPASKCNRPVHQRSGAVLLHGKLKLISWPC